MNESLPTEIDVSAANAKRRNGHGEGCECKGAWDDRYDCPWFAQEYDLSHIPTTLSVCNVCNALLPADDGYEHMRWHEGQGHMRVTPPAEKDTSS